MIPSALRRFILVSLGVIWAVSVGAGFVALQRYKATPGAVGQSSRDWPADSRIVPDPNRANLVMLAHPRCPCTRASFAELAHVMTRCQGLVTAHVLFLKPEELAEPWERTELWRIAESIPGTRVQADPGGREAARFGAKTSGHVLLYDPSGKLLFSGGITGARGHEGDNPGRDAVIALALGHSSGQGTTPVFGCPLSESQERPPRGM